MCMNMPREIRRSAITVLRNQLAKHSFDDRYASKVCNINHIDAVKAETQVIKLEINTIQNNFINLHGQLQVVLIS